jgi:hypothetical protein
MASYSSSHFYIVVIAGALVGVLAVVVRLAGKQRSSWPTWLVLPLVACMALVLATESKPPDVLHPLYLVTTLVVAGRWAVALLARERDRGWILYAGILAAVAAVAFCGGIV